MKFGFKMFSNNVSTIKKAEYLINEDYYQYVELRVFPNTDYSPFVSLPIEVIHAPDFISTFFEDLRMMKIAIDAADYFNAKYIVAHPRLCRIDESAEYFEQINDGRLLIENLPAVGVLIPHLYGYDPIQIASIKGMHGFCLDVPHAIKAAIYKRIDQYKFLESFFTLNPSMIHLYDNDFDVIDRNHFDIGKGEFDFVEISERLRFANIKQCTLETPSSMCLELDGDIENINRLREYL